jgi:predicted nucleotidyltransferase
MEDTYLKKAQELVLRETSHLDCTIFLFGSRAGDNHRRSSDIDIGFSGLPAPLFAKIRDNLLAELEESVIPHHVNLVDFDAVPADFRVIAMRKVEIWKQSSHGN